MITEVNTHTGALCAVVILLASIAAKVRGARRREATRRGVRRLSLLGVKPVRNDFIEPAEASFRLQVSSFKSR